ncbi:Hypothetical protein SRAE_1000170600 [Strongyloides ratti]|uniref:Uncharacterized protein n=1 Tax=Strongyloides ratti TaxID=34506 RepID=A0A090L7E6_STRRB|nr:Hypothetical protein SRAE_1000170600 [Strongyloides ratti]CEF63444.1 Hypothetical protein SRAE_1000170600 [Strongyloides ratti]
MSQAPFKETFDYKCDMILGYQIEVIAVLVGSQLDKNSCYFEYDCRITQLSIHKKRNFKLLQYINCSNKNVPSDKNNSMVIQCSPSIRITGIFAFIIYMIN